MIRGLFLMVCVAFLILALGGGAIIGMVPVFVLFGLLIPIFIGVLCVGLVVMIVRRLIGHHEDRRMDLHQLQTDIGELKKELQEIKEYLADLTIQLDDQRFR